MAQLLIDFHHFTKPKTELMEKTSSNYSKFQNSRLVDQTSYIGCKKHGCHLVN